MIVNKVPEIVAPGERLSRYILQSNHIRKSDNTVKQDAFIPHPYEDLSVTRHLDLDEKAIWSIGEEVARQSLKTLHGRADNQTVDYLSQNLKVVSDSIPGNANHANVNGWPSDKPLQKIVAMEIASKAKYSPIPD